MNCQPPKMKATIQDFCTENEHTALPAGYTSMNSEIYSYLSIVKAEEFGFFTGTPIAKRR